MSIQAKNNQKPFIETQTRTAVDSTALLHKGGGLFEAHVSSVLPDGGYELDAGGEQLVATVALSCIFSPETQDRVLVAHDDIGRYLVLAIVARPTDLPLVCNSAQAIAFKAPAIRMEAEYLGWHADSSEWIGGEHSQVAKKIAVSAEEGMVSLKKGHVWVGQFSQIVNHLTSKVGTLFETFGIKNKRVEKLESVQNHVKQEDVKHQMNIRAGNLQISSRNAVQFYFSTNFYELRKVNYARTYCQCHCDSGRPHQFL